MKRKRSPVTLLELKPRQVATIVGINSGFGLQERLECLGLRPGAQVRKISSQLFGGPVVVQTGNTRIAIGRGAAAKVIVEVENEQSR